jgi:hypothetical protein
MAFRLKSYIKSKDAENMSINNMPGVDKNGDELTSDYVIGNIENLHNNCVDPIMRHFNNLPGSSGNSIGISSGYRCKELNSSLKPPGVKNSQHIHGCAADLIFVEGYTSDVFNWAIQNLPAYHQIIWEFPEKGEFSLSNTSPSWIHISYVEGNNPKVNSLASDRDDLHLALSNSSTERRGQYTHGITEADQTLV